MVVTSLGGQFGAPNLGYMATQLTHLSALQVQKVRWYNDDAVSHHEASHMLQDVPTDAKQQKLE